MFVDMITAGVDKNFLDSLLRGHLQKSYGKSSHQYIIRQAHYPILTLTEKTS